MASGQPRSLVSATGAVRPGRIRFEPALEGLRGFALLGMLCFHSQFAWAAGGFLPVSTFFTLSGYLITSLFLVEWERTGKIDLWSFWARRFRRLMPAALLTLGAMVLFGAFVATPEQRARLSDDVLWALLYVANWHFYLTDSAYANLFSAPSPVQHFWSLAIEEQYYFVFPLIVAATLRLGAGSRVVLGGGLVTLALASVLWSVWLRDAGGSIDRVYYGSDTRAAELLLGAVLAVGMYGRDLASRVGVLLLESLGTVALVVMVYLWSAVALEAEWLYTGGFAGYALLSVAVIAAAVQPAGPVRALLSIPVVRWSGRVSYGAYLFHWPVFLWLSAERTGLDDAALFTLRTIVTFALAGLSYELLESPIRTGRWLTGWLPYVVTPVAIVSVALATTVVAEAPRFDDGGYDPRADVAELNRFLDAMREAKPPPTEPPSREREIPRVAFYGDSTAVTLGIGVLFWLEKSGTGLPGQGSAELGCALAREGEYRWTGKVLERPEHCGDREKTWRASLARDRPDIAVVMVGPWEVCDRRLPGDDVWRHLGDPVLDDYMRREMLAVVDMLAADGALVIWLTHPDIESRDQHATKPPDTSFPESDPARMARLNALIGELEKARPGKVRVIDLAGHMRTLPGGVMDARYRPDGTHLDAEGSLKLSHDWLGAEILRVYRDAGSGH